MKVSTKVSLVAATVFIFLSLLAISPKESKAGFKFNFLIPPIPSELLLPPIPDRIFLPSIAVSAASPEIVHHRGRYYHTNNGHWFRADYHQGPWFRISFNFVPERVVYRLHNDRHYQRKDNHARHDGWERRRWKKERHDRHSYWEDRRGGHDRHYRRSHKDNDRSRKSRRGQGKPMAHGR